jgi:hypothetical protein
MHGLNSRVSVSAPAVVAAFKAALLHQGAIALLLLGAVGLAWPAVRAWRPGRQVPVPAGPAGPAELAGPAGPAEPAGRRMLRIGFGLLWIFDGALQAQPRMAVGLPSQVIQPAAASSPRWVQQMVSWATAIWSQHPVPAAAAAVWIQAGIGIWMLVAARGAWSRLAGLAGVGWGLVVWVFGESFGGVFAPGLTWLLGAPGAVLIYAMAGGLIALPERRWHATRLGKLTLAALGLFLAGMAVLQAWPGRGFWQGTVGGQPGTLTAGVRSMAAIPQPHFLSAWVSGFASLVAAHGFAVNLVAVAALAVTGAVFLSGRPRLIRLAVIAFAMLCLADWVLIQDLGLLGGLGTDPNSMPPFALLAVAGYLALAGSRSEPPACHVREVPGVSVVTPGKRGT